MIAERRHRSLGLRIGVAQRRGADQRLHHRPVYDPDASRLAASGDGRAFDVEQLVEIEEAADEIPDLPRRPRYRGADRNDREVCVHGPVAHHARSEENTSELQSLLRITYAVSCLKKKKQPTRKYVYH